jgi:hypothetical protein
MDTPRITLLVELSQDRITYTVDGDDVAIDIIQLEPESPPFSTADALLFRGERMLCTRPVAVVDPARVVDALGTKADAAALDAEFLNAESME